MNFTRFSKKSNYVKPGQNALDTKVSASVNAFSYNSTNDKIIPYIR